MAMISACSWRAASMKACGLTLVPRSTTLNALTCNISATMFLPISWMSPCAVPITTVPADPLSPPLCRMAGSSTSCCMALTTSPARHQFGQEDIEAR